MPRQRGSRLPGGELVQQPQQHSARQSDQRSPKRAACQERGRDHAEYHHGNAHCRHGKEKPQPFFLSRNQEIGQQCRAKAENGTTAHCGKKGHCGQSGQKAGRKSLPRFPSCTDQVESHQDRQRHQAAGQVCVVIDAVKPGARIGRLIQALISCIPKPLHKRGKAAKERSPAPGIDT